MSATATGKKEARDNDVDLCRVRLTVGRCLLIYIWAVPSLAQPNSDSAGLNEFRKWRKQRERSLRSETGYLALVGLYWLKDGRHAFGSAPENDIVFPKGRAPAHAGHIQVDEKTDSIRLAVAWAH